MCHSMRMKEVNGVKVVQYLDYCGNVEFEEPLEPIVEPKQEEPLRPLQVSYNKRTKHSG